MFNVRKAVIAVALIAPAFLLGACATKFDVDGIAKMQDKGDAFAQALHKRYVERAKFEVSEQDWTSVDFFAGRAEMAANGMTPKPQPPAERKLKVDVSDIKAGHDKLMAALGANAQQKTPDECALAQTWLEHWMEQSEEGWQMDHIAEARKGFETNMPKCVGAPPAPPPMANPGPFDVFFGFDSKTLDKEAMATIQKIVDASKAYKPATVTLKGHTDTSGANAYNEALANARTAAVAGALKKGGVVGNVTTSAHGEMMPRVATGDNVKEGKNRRVEVGFSK